MDAQQLFNPKTPEKKGGFFGGSKKPAFFGPNLSEVSNQVNNVSRRLRILEERYLNLRKKTQLTEQNMIASNKKALSQIRDLFSEVTEVRSDLKKINDQISVMASELSECANRHELMALDKYIEFWNPMEFLTVEQAQKMIKELYENKSK